MSSARSFESTLLSVPRDLAAEFCSHHLSHSTEARFQLLEATAARLGGFELKEFFFRFDIAPLISPGRLLDESSRLIRWVEQSGIHPALALSALSQEDLDASRRRNTGAYHTDFRLATRLATLADPKPRRVTRVIDPACGAGMLLAAVTIQACGRDRKRTARWLAESVYAADLSTNALRGARLTLASLTSDLGAVCAMYKKWLRVDSLLAPNTVWDTLAPSGFDLVVGNPPWEKIKLTRHEFLKSEGRERHYGAEIATLDAKRYGSRKKQVGRYSRELAIAYPLAPGELDLYVAFAALFDRLCKPGGVVSALLPAGLIRSQGTTEIRKQFLRRYSKVSLSVVENRARFFSIDSRFKFVILTGTKAATQKSKHLPILLRHERGNDFGLEQTGLARIGRDSLASLRSDLSIPEVRSAAEWQIFRKMTIGGTAWTASGWRPSLCREVDMTRDRAYFSGRRNPNMLPLIEGRMVHHHRVGAKGYLAGTGRRAEWRTIPFGRARIEPQFYIASKYLSQTALQRTQLLRGGFCDITGQTNERTMMAALISPGVVCGNKVPTVVFPDDPSEERLLVWVAVMNSLPFDWMLRRVVTTTVNYFVLLSLPLPRLVPYGLPWRQLAAAANRLRRMDEGNRSSNDEIAILRSQIDAEVAVAYGLTVQDTLVMLRDFPLLDRGQPTLPGEMRSTMTGDYFLSALARRQRRSDSTWQDRILKAKAHGAAAYQPAEFRDSWEETLPKVAFASA